MNTYRYRFRVWNKSQRAYLGTEWIFLSRAGNLVYPRISDFSTNPTICSADVIGDNLVIEQCTGIKDKNGRLIYEGDVIRFPHSTLKGSVRWCECFGAWVVKCKGRREMFFDPGWEIIWNIHEKGGGK